MTHIPVTLTDKQRANLAKLAAYLRALPADYREFDMDCYAPRGVRPSQMSCDTVACAAGHAPLAGIAPFDGEYWDDYVNRALIDVCSDGWSWCFSSGWQDTDNTPHGAGARIQYMLDHGLPGDWDEQIDGDAPLSCAGERA